MDLGEKLFEKISNWRRRKVAEDRRAFQYELSECDKALSLLIQPFFEEPIEIHAAKTSGVVGLSFYLPSAISFFDDRKRNRDLFVHQSLMMAGAQKLNLIWPKDIVNDENRREHFVKNQQLITQSVQELYPQFLNFQKELLRDFLPLPQAIQHHWLLWGGLSSGAIVRSNQEPLGETGNRSSKETPADIETTFEREEVDLDKEQFSPITHSFEKMETADEYQGGARATDGSDELEQHAEALRELKLKKVTRSGEAAASFLNSDVQSGTEFESSENKWGEPSQEIVFYPEWHWKKKTHMAKHCRLLISTAATGASGSHLKETLLQNHATAIRKYKQQLLQLCNQRKWCNQQLEGSEFDIDAYVRHITDVRNKSCSSGRLYLNQLLRTKDYQVLVLLDLSLSTDSFVEGRRVLDVELEAAGLIGLLAENSNDNTIVAGTYSETRHKCYFEYLKHENENWGRFYERASSVTPRGYTRLAPAIRHATEILRQSSAKKKLLLLLTDGKPTDYDGYEGRYGIEDIRKACREAQRLQIITKAFAVEKAAKYYFPQMFGRFEILANPEKMPESLVRTFIQSRSR